MTPLDRLAVTVLGDAGGLVVDERISDGARALELPRRILIAGGEREGHVRVLVWGLRGDQRVAFGHADAQLVVGHELVERVLLDAPPSDCDGDGVPDALDGCKQIADPAQDDADGDGITDACVPGMACPANLVTNPGFEASTDGWGGGPVNPTVISSVAGGRSGSFAARACKAPSSTSNEYLIQDSPDSVDAPALGAVFRGDGWVRSASNPGEQIDLRLGEFLTSGGGAGNPVIVGVPATADWQLVTATYTIAAGPASSLDIRFRVANAVDGACFEVDDVCLQELASGCE